VRFDKIIINLKLINCDCKFTKLNNIKIDLDCVFIALYIFKIVLYAINYCENFREIKYIINCIVTNF